MNSTLAIIPARGGSKGVPRKNLLSLAGKPLIAHTIEQAARSQHIDRLIVSTDDREIAQISKHYNAEVVWRPAEISGDTVSSELALLHTLEYLQLKENYNPDVLVFLQCTSPLTLAEDIDGTIQTLFDQNADTALSVTPFHYFLWHTDTDGNARGINHDKHTRLLRQQCETQYLETGAVYVIRTQGFLEAKHRFFGKTALYVMPQDRVLEIDDPVDFEIAEVLLRKYRQEDTITLLPENPAALILDFDGVFTDNKVLVYENGNEAVCCSRSDGWGLTKLKINLPILVISTEKNPVVAKRCQKLGVECINGVDDKLKTLMSWAHDKSINLKNVIYLGNDINDLDCLKAVGCSVVVTDAHFGIKGVAKIVLQSKGGNGAIRELCDLILEKLKNKI